jgi:hypothetical protein
MKTRIGLFGKVLVLLVLVATLVGGDARPAQAD